MSLPPENRSDVDGTHPSLKDVAAAGGWKDTETLLTCYQQPDADTLLAVMSEPKMRYAALALLKHKAPPAQLPTVLRVRPVGTAGFDASGRVSGR